MRKIATFIIAVLALFAFLSVFVEGLAPGTSTELKNRTSTAANNSLDLGNEVGTKFINTTGNLFLYFIGYAQAGLSTLGAVVAGGQ